MSQDQSNKQASCFQLRWLIIDRLKLSEIWQVELSRVTLKIKNHRSHYKKRNGKVSTSLNTRRCLAQGTVRGPYCYNSLRSVTEVGINKKPETLAHDNSMVFQSDSNSHATSKFTDCQPPGIYNSLRQNLYTNQFKYPETSTSSNPGAVWRPDLSRDNSLQPPHEVQNVVWISERAALSRGPTLQFSPSMNPRR